MTVAADPGGTALIRRVGMLLAVASAAAVVGGALGGGTVVAGVPVPGAVGVASGVVLAAPAVLILRWTSGRRGRPALWDEGDVLHLGAHAGPVLRVHRADISRVGPVRLAGSLVERLAFGNQLFVVSTAVEASPGVRQVPVGSRYVAGELGAARRALLGWIADA